jgi:transaldolase
VNAGADIVSFFWNRINDGKGNAYKEVSDFTLRLYPPERKKVGVICGSIRSEIDVLHAWSADADYVTVSDSIMRNLLSHPQTDIAIDQFNRAMSWH